MDTLRLRNSQGQIWLNIGSSHYVLEDFVNLDNHPFLLLVPLYSVLRPLLNSDHLQLLRNYWEAKSKATLVRHDCRQPLPFVDESVDHILCSHFLHHVYPDEAARVIQEFRRVLHPHGTLHMIEPSLTMLFNKYLKDSTAPTDADAFIHESEFTHDTRPRFRYRLLELLGFEGLRSRWMYERQSLLQRLTNAGFELVPENNSPSNAVRPDERKDNINFLVRKI